MGLRTDTRMTRITNLTRFAGCALTLSLAASLFADSVQVGGPLRPGHGRPALHVNLSPSAPISYSPVQIRHAYNAFALIRK
jgi:hypothetical protein